MARRNIRTNRRAATKTGTSVRVSRPEEKTTGPNQGLFEKIQYDLQHNQSYLNLILGGLIVVVLGVLVYNYFNRPTTDLGTSQQTETLMEQSGDVSKDDLPGNYTVKEGDTLFSIAENYYDDGFKYPEIAKANSIQNENALETGQVINIPSLETPAVATASEAPEASVAPVASEAPVAETSSTLDEIRETSQTQTAPTDKGAAVGGAENATIWGDRITGNTYTVQAGDWLSKIAGRAYGDVMAFERIAQANNISNPDNIDVGTVLKLPR